MSTLATIRPATLQDVSALAALHVQTFNEAHGSGPSVGIREPQWRQKLSDEKTFCFLAIDPQRELVGFVSGQAYELDDLPFDGQLEKIYVLRAWQRQGVGRQLVTEAARTFLGQGIQSMLLFSQADNPSIGFFDRLGGQRLITPKGEFHGGYGWPDIRPLVG